MTTERTYLEPGPYIGAPMGHYQTPMLIELAIDLGYQDKVLDQTNLYILIQAYNENEDCTVYTRKDNPHTPGMEHNLEAGVDLPDWINETRDDAEDYINEHHVPEGYWFGHHPDMGDVGVWEIEED